MKLMKGTLMFLLVCLVSPLMAQGNSVKGMEFFDGTWDELLKAAKAQKKMIFLDMYTDWCVPCKEMDKFVFPLEAVGKKYNPLFLNYKVNAEKGEGKDIAKRFNVSAYPTFLYLNGGGYLVHKVVGGKKVAAFSQLADEAVKLGADKNTLGNMEAEFADGNRELGFLKRYIAKMTELDVDNSKALDEYYKAVPYPDLKNEATLMFIGRNIFDARSAALLFFMEHYDLLGADSKKQLQAHLYNKLVGRALAMAIAEKRFLEVRQLANFIDKIGPLDEKQTTYKERLMLLYYDQIRDIEQVKKNGYRWAARYKDIPADSIRSADERRYKNFMAPFLTGSQDSTRHSDFQETQVMMRSSYAKEVAFMLYYVASLFASFPDAEKQALDDALDWTVIAARLDPKQKTYQEQIERLKKKMGNL